MITEGKYKRILKSGGMDMLELYDGETLVANIYLEHSCGTVDIRARDKFKGWQNEWDWGNHDRYEFGTRIQFEAAFRYPMTSASIRTLCIEVFNFDPGPPPED